MSADAYPFDVTTLEAPDGSISAKFVSFGATLTELWVKDKAGKPRDVVLGYDDPSRLQTDPDHPVFNAIVGRYANRMKGGSFSIPITKERQPPGPGVYQIPTNDHDDRNTLHGGIHGWDRRSWSVVSKSSTSVTYHHADNADEGFPGVVDAHTTHTVENGGILKTTIHATASELTPIMLTQHVYWNLDAFDGSDDVLAHHLRVAASRIVEIDSDAIPTGVLADVAGTPRDFRTAQRIDWRWDETLALNDGVCKGYDHCWVYDGTPEDEPGVSLWSDISGIRLDITTNNPAAQVYTGNWLDTPRKVAHGGPERKYTSHSAVAIEQEGYIDAINTPEWGVDQIYGPGRDYTWSTTCRFSTVAGGEDESEGARGR